jgi:transcription initiation factor TFIIIB Brf1 subunit/transcription initiation factor TFIIB
MQQQNVEYICESCGIVVPNSDAETQSYDDKGTSGSASCRSKYYSSGTDYSHTQRKYIADQLTNNAKDYKGKPILDSVLSEVATSYNNIQRHVAAKKQAGEAPTNADTSAGKRWVRRGGIKDEVLACLLYFECIRQGDARKKRDIAQFMKLSTSGFSRGEGIVRELQTRGDVELPECDDVPSQLIRRYCSVLGVEYYAGFVREIVEESEKRKIGMHSQVSSKIVGTIWVLLTHMHRKITAAELEKCTDGTKKNTFMKFSNLIPKYMDAFSPIFIKYGVPINAD